MDKRTRMGPRRAAAFHAWALAQEALQNAPAGSPYSQFLAASEEIAWEAYEKAAAEEEHDVQG